MVRVHDHRLLELWSWLPAFRFVAETEHLPTAAELLYTSPSNLSRSIRLLERHIGRRLFDRVGRKLVLNDDGKELLEAVRTAMRGIDDGLALLTSTELHGVVRVGSTTQVGTTWLVESVPELLAEHPRVQVEVSAIAGELAPQLLQGRLDVALVEGISEHRGLLVERVGRADNAVYCGEGHPLWEVEAPTLEDVLEHPFVAPPDFGAAPVDNWPPELPRKIALRVDQLRVALQVCLRGHLLAVLPAPIASYAARTGTLRRLDAPSIEPSTIYAVMRTPMGQRPDPARIIVDAMVRTAADETRSDEGR